MKTRMCIFAKMISMVALGAIMGGAYIAYPAHAVIDNTGCDKEDNLYINPDLALCSTHVYNIGLDNNPDNAAQRQLMQDVVALKTTLITQQMYSQYEILETTVKRLRTQLQKEVLLAKLKSAGAISGNDASSDDGNSGTYKDKSVVLNGAKNCPAVYLDPADVLNCEVDNLNRVLENVSSNRGDAARQLQKDIIVIDRIVKVKTGSGTNQDEKAASQAVTECVNITNRKSTKADDINACVYGLRTHIANKLRELNRSNNQQRNNQGYY